MFSIFKEERDSEGRAVVEIGMNQMLFQFLAIAAPLAFLGFAYFAVGRGPLGLPWFLVAAPILFGAISYAAVVWMCKRSRVRVTVDGKAGKLLVATSAGQSEIRMAEVAKAEFGATSASEGGTVYRLEFVMKNGERVPATTTYSNVHGLGLQAKTVAAINAALGRQMA